MIYHQSSKFIFINIYCLDIVTYENGIKNPSDKTTGGITIKPKTFLMRILIP